jgi:hypothetical protein
MRCVNCGNTDCFVLVVELTVIARGVADFADPDWGLSLECRSCASTDVEGDPAALLAARTG